MKVGILALQGAFREHREVLDALGVDTVEVRVPEQLDALDALILPGGESTTMSRLLDTSGLRAPLGERLAEGLPVLGTCAGMILLAIDVTDGPFPGVFIRAPRIERAGAGVEVLAEHDGHPVLARHGAAVVASFHPELSGDLRLHEWFLRESETR